MAPSKLRIGTPATPPLPTSSAPALNTRKACSQIKITSQNAVKLFTDACDKLKGMKTGGQNVDIKKDLVEFMTAFVEFMKATPPTNSELSVNSGAPDLKEDLTEIKQMLIELSTMKAKTWA